MSSNCAALPHRRLSQGERLALYKASWPLYFAFSRPLFRAMLPLHRWLDRAGLELLQVHLVGVYRKLHHDSSR